MIVNKVAVVGGGISGSVLAIALAQRGVKVELIEKAKEWRAIGHGITLQGNALKQFQAIGVLEELATKGFSFDNIQLFKANGDLIMDMPVAHTGGEDLPSTMGALRADLQGIFCDRILEDPNITVRTGMTVVSYTEDDSSVTLTFSDGTTGTYDIAVGSDGINSTMRSLIGITTGPTPVGMSIWRVIAGRPESMTCSGVYYGGPRYKAGYSPISKDKCYAYILDEDLDASLIGPNAPLEKYLERSEGYGGIYGEARAMVSTTDPVDFRRIEAVILDPDQPWYKGRVALVGDAVHACPPLIAQGGAVCAEDSMVLVDELSKHDNVADAFDAYWRRRFPRVRMVLDASMQLVEWEKHPDTPGADPGPLMGKTLAMLAAMPA